MPIRVFVDSDVILSSLLSKTGAAHLLMQERQLKRFVSDPSRNECLRVAAELGIPKKDVQVLIRTRCTVVRLEEQKKGIVTRMGKYTLDPHDAHIVAGAAAARATFLVTYNTRHFRSEQIRDALGIIVLTPALLLQYLRSLN